MLVVSEYCKKQIDKVTLDFKEDIKSMQKLRARDRSDYDLIVKKQQDLILNQKHEIDVHSTYFETFATCISLLTENINMQMEGEYSDVKDRNLMGLYGINSNVPLATDHLNNSSLINKYNRSLNRVNNPAEPSKHEVGVGGDALDEFDDSASKESHPTNKDITPDAHKVEITNNPS